MPEPSTTPDDDQKNGDGAADTTTSTGNDTGTDNQPADKGDNLDEASKSTDTTDSADGDKTSTDDKSDSDDKSGDDDKGEGADDDTPASKFDDDLDDWAAKRNMPKAETDEQRQAYQDLRDSQREFTKKRQAEKEAANSAELAKANDDLKSELKGDDAEGADDDDDEKDPLEKTVEELKADRDAERTTRLQSEFYQSNSVTDAEHKQILEVIKEKVNRPATTEGKLQAHAIWTHPSALPDLLDIARARIANSTDKSAIADEAAREERERIAKESQAASSGRGAKVTTPAKEKTDDERRLELWDKD